MKRKFCVLGAGIILLGIGLVFLFSCRRGRTLTVYEKINAPEVFLKQEEPSGCTLCAAAMMLRRAAILSGDKEWERLGEKQLKKNAWIPGEGLRHSFSYGQYQVEHGTLPGGEENEQILRELLLRHPEGIVLYYGPGENQHAVLLTDAAQGIFYCADPYGGKPEGRMPLTEASYVTACNARSYWYVKNLCDREERR